jgi:hypothetical protein
MTYAKAAYARPEGIVETVGLAGAYDFAALAGFFTQLSFDTCVDVMPYRRDESPDQLPAATRFISQAIFRARFFTVSRPSASLRTSPFSRPKATFQ